MTETEDLSHVPDMKNDHLVEAIDDAQAAIGKELYEIKSGFGWQDEKPTPDEKLVARLQARVDAMRAELTSRGISEDGYTIVDEAKYDAYRNRKKS